MSYNTVPTNINNNTLFREWLNTINVILDEERYIWVELDKKAPKDHADSGTAYGVATSEKYGHLKITDIVASTLNGIPLNASSGIAITPAALYDINNELTNSITVLTNNVSSEIARVKNEIETALSNLTSDIASNYAPMEHLSDAVSPSDNPYGTGDDTHYGHLKLSDSILSTTLNASQGTAATPAALNEVYTILDNKIDSFDIAETFSEINSAIENLEDTKAPKNHASSDTEYGVGTETKYGHLKITSDFANWISQDGDKTSTDKTISMKFLSDFNSELTTKFESIDENFVNIQENFGNYAPLSHIDVIANNQTLGHVKVTDAFTENDVTYVMGDGVAVSANAFQQFLHNGINGQDSYYNTISNINQQIQNISEGGNDNTETIQNLQKQIGTVHTDTQGNIINIQTQIDNLDNRIEDLEELPISYDTLIFSDNISLNDNDYQYALCICRNSNDTKTVTLSNIGSNHQVTIKNESDYNLTVSVDSGKTIDKNTMPLVLGKYDSVTLKQNPGENDINFSIVSSNITLSHSAYSNDNTGSIEIFMTSRDANYFDINTNLCTMLIRTGSSNDSSNVEFSEKIVVLHSIVNTEINYPNSLVWMNNSQSPKLWKNANNLLKANETLILKLLQIGQVIYATVMHNSQIVNDLDNGVKG